MDTHIVTVDNFLDDPLPVRELAMSIDFNVAPEFQGHKYKGVVPVVDSGLLAGIETGLTKVHGKPVSISLAFFRMSLAGEDTPAWIHADPSCDKYAAVLYLTRPRFCFGGTAFWRHRELGWDALPDGDEFKEQAVIFNQQFANRINVDGQSADAWEMVGLSQMKFNRLVTYPSKLFHSRWPKDSFGTNYDNGRLILACFYSVL